jgi:hypothetical protein
VVNAYNIDNPMFESLWRKLTRTQRLFITRYHEFRTKKDCAEAVGVTANTVYAWPDYVWKAAELYEDHIAGAALITLQDNVTKAALIKAAGLDSSDERIQQMSATEILDRYFGKPKQRTELTGEDGDGVNINVTFV